MDKTLSITCPRCGRTSYHPNDVAEGYCGHCHAWTAHHSPDCRAGKHPACDGSAWDDQADALTDCMCSCHA